MKILFLLRHAAYRSGEGGDPRLSDHGKEEALELAKKIKAIIGDSKDAITIWSSSAKRAAETAEIIQQEIPLAELVIEEQLWSGGGHREDFHWLKQKLDEFDGEILIIMSHLEYVRDFPAKIGFSRNWADYAEGVKIENGECVDF